MLWRVGILQRVQVNLFPHLLRFIELHELLSVLVLTFDFFLSVVSDHLLPLSLVVFFSLVAHCLKLSFLSKIVLHLHRVQFSLFLLLLLHPLQLCLTSLNHSYPFLIVQCFLKFLLLPSLHVKPPVLRSNDELVLLVSGFLLAEEHVLSLFQVHDHLVVSLPAPVLHPFLVGFPLHLLEQLVSVLLLAHVVNLGCLLPFHFVLLLLMFYNCSPLVNLTCLVTETPTVLLTRIVSFVFVEKFLDLVRLGLQRIFNSESSEFEWVNLELSNIILS